MSKTKKSTEEVIREALTNIDKVVAEALVRKQIKREVLKKA